MFSFARLKSHFRCFRILQNQSTKCPISDFRFPYPYLTIISICVYLHTVGKTEVYRCGSQCGYILLHVITHVERKFKYKASSQL